MASYQWLKMMENLKKSPCREGYSLGLNFIAQGPVPERPISANPGLRFCSPFWIYLPMHCLEKHFV